MKDTVRPLRLAGEVLGLSPWRERARQTLIALRGQEDVPPSRFGLSSLAQLRPRIALNLWRGRPYIERTVLITNLFNHLQTPIEDGWSVKKTQVRDFRARRLTYDSHNGTDFSIPVGTTVRAPAPGVVVRVVSEFNRGGLKIFIDHGDGLMTTCAHLARALVSEGQPVARGEAIALSGYSGLDALVTFPFGTPHVHFNTWLNGEPVDPFPHDGQVSMWRGGDLPAPVDGVGSLAEAVPSDYDKAHVDEGIAACTTAAVRAALTAIEPLGPRAARLLIEMNYYPTRFPTRVTPYSESHARRPVLDLPFSTEDFDGLVFADDL